jgi:hypothetical protein
MRFVQIGIVRWRVVNDLLPNKPDAIPFFWRRRLFKRLGCPQNFAIRRQ